MKTSGCFATAGLFGRQQPAIFISTGSSGNKHLLKQRNEIIDSDTHLNVTWLFCIRRRERQQYM
jgi:hypothetical protein